MLIFLTDSLAAWLPFDQLSANLKILGECDIHTPRRHIPVEIYYISTTIYHQNCFNAISIFNQNHRRYVRSLDPSQLHGNLKSAVSSNCQPFDKVIDNQKVQKTVAPCGAIANSLFNGTPFLSFPLALKIYFRDTCIL